MLRLCLLCALLSLSLLSYGPAVEGKVYLRCNLYKELYQKNKLNRSFLSVWVCLIEHVSSSDTSKLLVNPNGSSSYGLFQLNSIKDCSERRAGDFLDENIDDDIECAKRIHEIHGFKYWRGWMSFCNNTQNLPQLSVLCNNPF